MKKQVERRIVWIGEHPEFVEPLASAHHGEWGGLYLDWSLRAAADELRDHMQRRSLPTTLLLMEGDALLGSVSLLLEDAPALQDRGSPWLGSLYVMPESRGDGAGRMLVDAGVAHAAAQGVQRLRLFTLWHEALYESLGWQIEERTHLQGMPIVIMGIEPAARVTHNQAIAGAAPHD